MLDATCGRNDGGIWIVPTSGTAPFMYSINGGMTYVPGPASAFGFTNLAAGAYQLRLKDANGCESAIVTRTVSTLYGLPAFLNNSQIVLDASCGRNDGNITIVPTSGTGPFMYSINGGTTYVSGPNSGLTFNNLAPGTYQLRLKTASGCESPIVERTVRTVYNCPGITVRGNGSTMALAPAKEVVLTYPNPSRGQFKVQLQNFVPGKSEVSVFDAKGTLIQRSVLNVSQNATANFDLSRRAAGVYYIKIVGNSGTKLSKVLIQ